MSSKRKAKDPSPKASKTQKTYPEAEVLSVTNAQLGSEPLVPHANVITVDNAQIASTQWGDREYLAKREKIVDELDKLESEGKTESHEYNRLDNELYDLDTHYMSEFQECNMDIDIDNEVHDLDLDLGDIIDELETAHAKKEELEHKLQVEKGKLQEDKYKKKPANQI